MPVRDHRNHEVTLACDPCSPGPGAYAPSVPKNRMLGFFGRSGRDNGALVPEDLRTPTLRRDWLNKPAPNAHDVTRIPGSGLKIAVRFARAKRFVAGVTDDFPGPGTYKKEPEDPAIVASKHGVSFTHDKRTARSLAEKEDVPGPGTYSPSVPPKRVRSAAFARASRAPPEPKHELQHPSAKGADGSDQRRARISARSTPISPMSASRTTSVSPGVSFPRAPRYPDTAATYGGKTLGPGPGLYSPGFAAVDKRPRSAVLYLGA